ncbi:MAG: hypothetical protein ABFD50_21705 [Smithella sp.]
MPNEITPDLIRQAKYEGFIRHTAAMYDEAKTSQKFADYVEKDKAREQKFVDLRANILDGLKGN